ncbi:MAG: hypothetical protein ABI718_01115 [Acidobacteriota bacterium]
MIAFIVWVGARKRQREVEAITQVQTKMLDKFGSAPEFVDFLRSGEGLKFLQGFALERRNPAEKLFGTIRSGIVLSFFGAAFLALAALTHEDPEGFMITGVLIGSVGAGFLVTAYVANRMSRAANGDGGNTGSQLSKA